ncbi:MAG: hypothetical protein U1E89_04025 [Burkholderiaceae bacterium]
MSESSVTTVTLDPERESSLRAIGHISYALHAIVAVAAVVPGFQVSILLLVAAFLLDVIKKGDARGTWQESHFSWRIRSVVWAMVLYALAWVLVFTIVLIPIAWLMFGVVSIWFLYRVARGWLALNDRKPMPM